MAELDEYLWMVVVGVIAGFVMAFGIGANDVANAFASSVAAKSLSLGQAIVVASIFEFLGAVLLGQSVSGTIRGKIINPEYYEHQPEIFMFGMLCALIMAAIWLLTATSLELPVSTTHTIVAGIIGFSLAAEGFPSVDWGVAGKVFLSWLISPTFTGILSMIFFASVKRFVLDATNTFDRAMKTFPIVIFAGVAINVGFILAKSKKKISERSGEIENYGLKVVLPCALGSGLLCTLVFWLILGPRLETKVKNEHEEAMVAAEAELQSDEEVDSTPESSSGGKDKDRDPTITEEPTITAHDGPEEDSPSVSMAPEPLTEEEEEQFQQAVLRDPVAGTRNKMTKSLHNAWNKFAESTYKQDIAAESFKESKRAKEIWENSEATDPQTERLFAYLQVFTACLTAFAHGSNDVANGIAPVSAIIDVYKYGELRSTAEVHKGLLAMGGFAICLGFTLYGYKIIKAVGFKLTCMTPSRGFCIQLAAALAVSLASFLQIPVSSTQCLVGATVGAGVAGGGLKQVQWLYLLRVTTGWVVTFFATCITGAGFFAYCVYSPSLVDS